MPYLGEIRMFAGDFAPRGWALCHGGSLFQSEYQDLYQLIGRTYGYGGKDKFALPNLRYRIPIHKGQGEGLSPRELGQKFGTEGADVDLEQLPAHTHQLMGSTDTATSRSPGNSQVVAKGGGLDEKKLNRIYSTNKPQADMGIRVIAEAGDQGIHDNDMPTLNINFIIATTGLYPSAKQEPGGYAEPYTGEIRIFPYSDYIPRYWAACNGQLAPIAANQTLYAVIETIYGGDGRLTLGLPDMRARAPKSYVGNFGNFLGSKRGTSSVALSGETDRYPLRDLPRHSHTLHCDGANTGGDSSNDPTNNALAKARFQGTTNNNAYGAGQPGQHPQTNHLAQESLSVSGSGEPHNNMQPYLGVQFCICLYGEFPIRPRKGSG